MSTSATPGADFALEAFRSLPIAVYGLLRHPEPGKNAASSEEH